MGKGERASLRRRLHPMWLSLKATLKPKKPTRAELRGLEMDMLANLPTRDTWDTHMQCPGCMQFVRLSEARERCPECGDAETWTMSSGNEHPIEISSDDEILELTKDEEYPSLE